MDAVERYLEHVRLISDSGAAVPETSYYPPLAELLNEIGRTLDPKVRCIINLADRGAGLPDGGLFTADQLKRKAGDDAFTSQVPSRGAVEVKPPSDEVQLIARGEQVTRYLARYRQVLVTNLREFALFGLDADGRPVRLEHAALAPDEAAFWERLRHPRALAQHEGPRLVECLKRVMLHAAPLAAPQDVAAFLASYARDARARLEHVELPALATLRTALEEALAMRFEGEKGEHFFRSTLVQTLFYGVFSAWVLWAHERPRDDRTAVFDWRTASWSIELPVLRTLFYQIAAPAALQPLDLVELVDSACRALNRVDRVQFFERFEQGLAVQYFYEPFLEAFDPDLRKQLGVWYTPREIVQYQVARVDTVLREELDVADGLADPNVVVLDPCCGTGTYLVEVLKSIAATLKEKGGDALLANDLKRAAQERIFGFEILPAPFVVAHLQLGLLLANLGAPLAGDHERVGVYLTNALTGWEPPTGAKQKVLPFPDLEEEREAAQHVKRDQPILVILGNPPYNAFAGVSSTEEHGIVDVYKQGLTSEWGIRKYNLDDLYVRFLRVAERRIAEGTGRGVISYISNYSYLGDPSFVVMRQRLLAAFDSLWFDCLNGDSRETGKLTPDGKPDPSVFSTERNRAGIRVGTSVCVLVRRRSHGRQGTVKFREFWGVSKREDLLDSLSAERFAAGYSRVEPAATNRYSFRPERASAEALSWPSVSELSLKEPLNGPIERRGNSLIAFKSEGGQFSFLEQYLDPNVPDEVVAQRMPQSMISSGEFDAPSARRRLAGRISYDPRNIDPYTYKPLDDRLAYLDPNLQPLFSRPSPELLRQRCPKNRYLVVRESGVTDPTSPGMLMTTHISDYHALMVEAKHIPFLLRAPVPVSSLPFPDGEAEDSCWIQNLSDAASRYLRDLGANLAGALDAAAERVFLHVLAVGYAPSYCNENAGALRQDWPRVPMPASNELLDSSAALGRQVAGMLDPECDVAGVTSGSIRAELRVIGSIASASGRALDPATGDLAVTAGWGHGGKGGITMPGKGRLVERAYTSAERDAVAKGATALGLSGEQAFALLGETCCDVFLNERAYWRCVPKGVWTYTIGGYQVIKKWLSYRERDLLGRDLTPDEARYVTEMVRRIAAIILLHPQLDASYAAVKANTYPWPYRTSWSSRERPSPPQAGPVPALASHANGGSGRCADGSQPSSCVGLH